MVKELSTYRSSATFSVAVVFMATSTISIILRLISKRISKQKLVIEDWVILVAQVLIYGMGTCAILAVLKGSVGHHAKEVPPHHIVEFLKILVALQIFYGSTLGLIKTSICLFYIRIFFIRPFRIAAYITIGFIISWSVMVILTGFLLCTPFAFNWNSSIPGGHCGNQTATYIAVGVLDLVIDCAVFILPIPMIWNLKVSQGNKIALFGIFGLGLFTMVISILRIQALVSVSFADITYTAAFPVLWSFLEPAIGISVACGPILRPLVSRTRFGRHFKTRNANSKKGSSGGATFERLEEPAHPLIEYPGNTMRTTVSAKLASPKTAYFEAEENEVFPKAKPQRSPASSPESTIDGGIVVKKEWNIRSSQ